MTISGIPSSVTVGLESTPIVITVPNYPLGDLTLIPFVTTPDVTFNPPSIHMTRTSTSLVSSFTILARHAPTTPLRLNIAINGTDALYYTTGFGWDIQVNKSMSIYSCFLMHSIDNSSQGSFLLPNFPALVVGLPSQPLTVALTHPTPSEVRLQLASPSALFTPSELIFTPDVLFFSLFYSTGVLLFYG